MFVEKTIENLLRKFKKKNIDTSLSGLCHFSNSEAVLGYHYLTKIILKKKYISFSINFLKHIFAISKLHNVKVFKSINFNIKEKKKIKIFITWGNKKDFDSKGNFKDKITNLKSSNKDIYFFIIYEDDRLPHNLKNNVALIHLNGSKNYFFLFKFILKYIFDNLGKPRNLLHYFNYTSQLSLILFDKFNFLFEAKKINSIHFPYEGQQFQNYLIKKMKIMNSKIVSTGYLSHMHSFQTDVFKRDGAPDFLYVFSPAQKKYLENYLGWKRNQLKLIYSYRLQKKKKDFFNGNVYFSYKFKNKQKILNNFRIILNSGIRLPHLNFFPHPNPYNLKDQKILKEKLLEIYQNNKAVKKESGQKVAIVIGISTMIFFLLEHGIEVIHFHSNDNFEKLNTKGWKNITVRDINSSISIYKLKKYGSLIKMKKNKQILKLGNL